MEKAWSLALWSVLVCRIAIITDNSKGDGTGTIPRQKGRSKNRGFGVAVRKVRCHRGEDGTVRVSSVETMHERRYTVDDWRYDTAHCEQTENGQKG